MSELEGVEVHIPRAENIEPLAREGEFSYEPFARGRWTHEGSELERFFQRFVSEQYAHGFCFRCEVIGKGSDYSLVTESERAVELGRAKPFDEHSRNIQEVIAGNAEVLLELFEETNVRVLDSFRELGKSIVLFDPEQFNAAPDLENLLAVERSDLGKRHHVKWLEQFQIALDSGRRNDADHRGNRPFEELPAVELEILRVQSWANIRVLGSLSDGEYEIVRNVAIANKS